jgi:fatty acid desaturase
VFHEKFVYKSEVKPGSQSLVHPKELTSLVQDLRKMRPWPGLQKLATLLLILTCLCWIIFGTDSLLVFLGSSVMFSVVYASLLITTHDASHGTLTGWHLFDEVFPRVISILPFWPHGTYTEIHKLHHKMNGAVLEDPERTHWTIQEYKNASWAGKLYAKHQVLIRSFVFGGFGLLAEMIRDGVKFGKRSKGVRKALWFDLCTLTLGFSALVATSIHFGKFWKFAALYLVLERVTGGILQTRNTIEHYGLWGKMPNYFETQIFNCRNIKTNFLMSWYFNGLNFHSAHHAFPDIPFFNLEEAHGRFQKLFSAKNRPLVEDDGYFKTFGSLLSHPCLVNASPEEILVQSENNPSTEKFNLKQFVTVISALRPSQNAKAWMQAVQKRLGSFPFAG